jgi:NAD(P)H-flavin reductase
VGSHSKHPLAQIAGDLQPISDDFTKRVFARLFARDGSARDKFPAGMTEVRRMFFRVLHHTLVTIPIRAEQEELIELLAQLGRDHRKYGITEQQYELMRTAIIEEVHAVYQDTGGMSDDDAAVLEQAISMITGVMRGGAHSDPTPAVRTAKVVQVLRPQRGLTIVRMIAQPPMLFRPGQYIEVQLPQLPHIWRPLSPAMPSNTAGQLEFHVRAKPGGVFSSTVSRETAPGDEWRFGQVHGLMRPDGDRPLTLVAGGTGLAPFKAILLQLATRADNPPTHLIVGAKSPGALYDAAALLELAATNPWLQVTQITDERRDPWWMDHPITPPRGMRLRHGTVVDVLEDADLAGHRVMLAGPPAMIEAARGVALHRGVRPDQLIHDPY